jgi:hypothetical protein
LLPAQAPAPAPFCAVIVKKQINSSIDKNPVFSHDAPMFIAYSPPISPGGPAAAGRVLTAIFLKARTMAPAKESA